jgi:long-chain acyl-CoA synthetase
MLGYWNRPKATEDAMSDGWLKTGDIVAMDDEGYFAVVDRLKDMINTAGFKVWPREVEETLYAHPAVKMAAVVGVADDYRGEAVKAFVVLKENCGSVDAGALTAFCRERLSGYKVPRLVELRDALPVTTTGKLLRRLLRESS